MFPKNEKPNLPGGLGEIKTYDKFAMQRQFQEDRLRNLNEDDSSPEDIDAEIFREISRGNFENLYLLRKSLPDEIAHVVIARFKNRPIQLSSMDNVPVGFLKLLIEKKHSRGISFSNVKNISLEAAEELSRYEGDIDLYNLSFDENSEEGKKILEYLAGCKGKLRIKSERIVNAIEILKRRQG